MTQPSVLELLRNCFNPELCVLVIDYDPSLRFTEVSDIASCFSINSAWGTLLSYGKNGT